MNHWRWSIPPKPHDLVGNRYGKLTVIDRAERSPSGNARWLCQCDCGNTSTPMQVNLQQGRAKSCGCSQIRPRPERTFTNGYAFVVAPPGHPRAGVSSGRIREHILVMEEHLGRYITKDEQVHHINGDRADNRIENLELWTGSHPAGARVEDHLKWALNIVRKYAPEMLSTQ